MSPEAQVEIEGWVTALTSHFRMFGRQSALELIWKLAIYQVQPHCRFCGAVISECDKQICRSCYLNNY